MRSLAGVGARSLAHRKGRSALTAIGIVLGVAILFGVLVTNASLDRAFRDLVDRYRQPWNDVAVRPIGANDATMPADLADRARALPDVVAVSPGIGFGVTLPDIKRASEQDGSSPLLFLIGVDFDRLGTLTRGKNRLAEGRYATAADEVVVSSHPPPEWHATVGSELHIATASGDRRVRVVGRYEERPADDPVTRHAFARIEFVQSLFGHGNVIDGITVDIRDGVDRDRWIAEHADALGPGVRIVAGGGGFAGFRPVLTTIQSSLTFVAAIALFVGAFLIYLTLSMAVVERTRLYGTLRALGATRRQVRRIVLVEATVLGVASTLAGMVLGLGMSVLLVRALSSLLRLSRPSVTLTVAPAVIALTAGVVTTVLSAWIPARRAAALAPVTAMRGEHQAGAQLGRAWIAGVAFSLLGAALALTVKGVTGMALSTFAMLTGVVLLVPVILRPLARLLGGVTRRAEPGVGEVAVMHLVKERSRSAYTLALVMVVFAMVFSIAAANASMSAALTQTIDKQFGSDLRAWSPNGFEPELLDAVRSTPHVAMLSEVRFGNVKVTTEREPNARGFSVRSSDEQLAIIDPATYFQVAGFVWTEGNDEDVKSAFREGGGVVVGGPVAARLGIHRGDTLLLATTQGPKPFRVAGLYAGFGGDNQPAFIGLRDGRTLFAAGKVSGLAINVDKGTRPADVQRALWATPAAKKFGLFVETASAAKAQAQSQLGGFFRVFYAVLLVAALVGLLGLTNTLAMSVLQRLREIGILRAIGTRRRQVRNMVVVEAATLVLVALLLALPLGWVLSVLFVRSATDALGFTAPYVYPWAWVPGVGFLALLIGGLGAIAPARRASRLDVVTALAYE